MRTIAHIFALLMLCTSTMVSADLTSATQAMEDPSHPLMLMRTSRGDIYIELFPESAPRNVANFIALSEGKVDMFDINTGQTVAPHYFDGKTFHRVLRNYLVQSGASSAVLDAPRPEYTIDDEINARDLGLNDIKVLDETGAPNAWLNLQDDEDFQARILVPLYERLDIRSPEQVEARQFELHKLLSEMSLRQAYEDQGYQFNTRLPPRVPVRGSVAMANSGPNTNQSEFFITLVDSPWLAGTTTIIGEVIEGMEFVDRIDQAAVLRGESTTPTPTTATMIFDIRQINAAPTPSITQ
jgi:cyclophilin family peptidyl-prolyl cis-trans isomerase